MLAEQFSKILTRFLIARTEWKPYPTYGARAEWQGLPQELRSAWIKEAERLLHEPWPLLTAARYMDFVHNGDRSRFEQSYFKRRGRLGTYVLAECLEGRGRFLEEIINGIWLLCEETSWCLPAHQYLDKNSQALPDPDTPLIDLFAADTASLLAWTSYLLDRPLSEKAPIVLDRIYNEIDRRIFRVYLDRKDFWWMGYGERIVNNWNPWTNSNVLAAVLLLERAESRRETLILDIMKSLDRYISVQSEDGGCDEGPAYWDVSAGSLFDAMELLYLATDGHINIYDQPLIQNLGKFVYRLWIDDTYFVNFADSSAIVRQDGSVVYRYGKRIGDKMMMALGQRTLSLHGLDVNQKSERFFFMFRELSTLFSYREMKENPPWDEILYRRDSWLSGIQVMSAREQGGSNKGFYLAAKGGHNDESHSHNDVGNFIVYYDGRPLLIDCGVETYSARTFGPERYDIWTMQSEYHNLPIVNGVGQMNGREYIASNVRYESSDLQAALTMDLTKAYPHHAGIRSWSRTCRLLRGPSRKVEIEDGCIFVREGNRVEFVLMTCIAPDILSDGSVQLTDEAARTFQLSFAEESCEVRSEMLEIHDPKLRDIWGSSLYRIRFEQDVPLGASKWKLTIKRIFM